MTNVKQILTEIATQNGLDLHNMQLPNCEIDPSLIKVVMINEVVPKNPDDWFYSEIFDAENRRTAFGLFENAGIFVKSMQDVFDKGIYITAALKTPKSGYNPDPVAIKAQLPLLEAELALFPNLQVIMLMGDVAKKAINLLAREQGSKKNIIPSGPTYKIRNGVYHWKKLCVLPSYIMTGKNLLIEKGKCGTISEDIRKMQEIVK